MEKTIDIELHLLVEAIYLKYNYDFRDYAQASLKRRVSYAMDRFGYSCVSELQTHVLHSSTTFMALLQFLTIPTTEMFRDPSYFLAIRKQVVPFLKTYPSLKIWVAGCSTGEELYSLAIVLKEEDLLDRSIIYATDINPHSLENARKGIFPLSRLRTYTENYHNAGGKSSFSDYYTAAYEHALFDRSLCDKVTFADHSLATDSVFSEAHLISCRNVLIYFNRDLQERAFGLFHESLCHRGFLGLGSKESMNFSGYSDRFTEFNQSQRLYRKSDDS